MLCTNITWRKLAIDLSGPYANGDYLLVLIDYYSRFPEVEIIRSITSSTIINKHQQTSKIFSIHGFWSPTMEVTLSRMSSNVIWLKMELSILV